MSELSEAKPLAGTAIASAPLPSVARSKVQGPAFSSNSSIVADPASPKMGRVARSSAPQILEMYLRQGGVSIRPTGPRAVCPRSAGHRHSPSTPDSRRRPLCRGAGPTCPALSRRRREGYIPASAKRRRRRRRRLCQSRFRRAFRQRSSTDRVRIDSLRRGVRECPSICRNGSSPSRRKRSPDRHW